MLVHLVSFMIRKYVLNIQKDLIKYVGPSGFFYDTKICIKYTERFDKICDKIKLDFKIGDLEKETE